MTGNQRVVLGLAASVVRNWELLSRLAQREYTQRFRGTVMGFVWAILTPLLLAVAYTFVFVVVFKVRWVGAPEESGSNFVVYLMVGLALHGILAECLSRAPTLILSNPSYVLRVIFPLEILPFTIIAPALVTAGVNLAVAVIINLAQTGHVHPTLIFAPLVVAPYLVFIVAVVILASAIGVYLRDVAHIVGLIITLAMFLSPVFYSIDAVPPAMRSVIKLNPLTFPIEELRAVVIGNTMPNWPGLAIYSAFALASLAAANAAFQRLRNGFADVL